MLLQGVCPLYFQRGKRYCSKLLLALCKGCLRLDFGSRFQRLHPHLDLLIIKQLQILKTAETGFCFHLSLRFSEGCLGLDFGSHLQGFHLHFCLRLLKAAETGYLSKCLPNLLNQSFRLELSTLLLEI
jgi:hypothetical protein